ncbi:hypothetical protein ACWD4F_07775 [Streptomyces aureus]
MSNLYDGPLDTPDDVAVCQLFHELHGKDDHTSWLHFKWIFDSFWTWQPVYQAADQDDYCRKATLSFIEETVLFSDPPPTCPCC